MLVESFKVLRSRLVNCECDYDIMCEGKLRFVGIEKLHVKSRWDAQQGWWPAERRLASLRLIILEKKQ